MTDVSTVDLSFLDERVFNEWLVAQRWFASKTREVSSIAIMDSVPLRTDPPLLVLTLVEARFPTGTHETYQVPLGLRPADEGWTERVIFEDDEMDGLRRARRPRRGPRDLHAMRSNAS